MRQIALRFLLAGLTLSAQPDLRTQAPALIAKCAPLYTPEARRARIEGKVVLKVEVSTDGKVRGVRVLRSLDAGLDENAVEAVKQWLYRPGTKNGEAVAVPATIEVHFRLDDVSEPCRAVGHA